MYSSIEVRPPLLTFLMVWFSANFEYMCQWGYNLEVWPKRPLTHPHLAKIGPGGMYKWGLTHSAFYIK